MSEVIFEVKPLTISRSLAQDYLRDADDFAQRFDRLWEALLHKSGRIKSFVDLLMGVECALKAHIFMAKQDEDPFETYRLIRRSGHSINALAKSASWLTDPTIYNTLAERLEPFSVFIRYRFDADQTFFPALVERDQAEINYSETIGKNPWVLEIRRLLEQLMDALNGEFQGFVTDDLFEIFNHEQALADFYKKVSGKK